MGNHLKPITNENFIARSKSSFVSNFSIKDPVEPLGFASLQFGTRDLTSSDDRSFGTCQTIPK